DDMHANGKLIMANSTPDQLCWLAPLLDVMGTETDWNHAGNWSPTSDTELMYRRAMCGAKPYCFLMNSDFTKFTKEMTEKYMKRALFYGMFPGFFSHNAAENTYFSQPELYNRDRDLFKKYVPLCKMVSESGWQPMTYAITSAPAVYIERFGENYWTVFNDSLETKTVRVTFDAKRMASYPKQIRELVNGKTLAEFSDGDIKERADITIEMQLGPEDVAVLFAEY
ncbi:MAG: hypothetical protein ACRC2T_20850, partial [Thermoguttaceae bacterium]